MNIGFSQIDKFIFNGNLKYFYYWIRSKFIRYTVPTTPCFDSDDTINLFISKLSKSKIYLEYGSGGSTFLAVKYGVPFISIDSDNHFIKSLKNKIKSENLSMNSNQNLIYADIGVTESWGYPVKYNKISNEKIKQFRKYSDIPDYFTDCNLFPDLVLIDGRFRVACALKVIKYLKLNKGWTILFDNYRDRKEYYIVEKYANCDYMIGKMAVFTSAKSFRPEEIDKEILKYETNPD